MNIGKSEFAAGWHGGVPMQDYLADHAVSASLLWQFHQASTPAHFREEIKGGDKPTPAKGLGSLVHTKVFEPELFDETYIVLGQCAAKKRDGERCSNTGTVWRDGKSYCGLKGHDPEKGAPMPEGKVAVTDLQLIGAKEMQKSIAVHATAGNLFSADGPHEVTGIARDPATGFDIRIRPDKLLQEPDGVPTTNHHSVVNLKTTGKSAAADPFERQCHELGYYFKAAVYRWVVRELWGYEPQNFLYPVVESYPPYAVVVYRLHEDAIDVGESEARTALNELARCIENDQWPAYRPAIQNLTLPEWRMRQVHSIDFMEVA